MPDLVKIAELPPLDEDQRDDACYRGRDRAWSGLVSLYDHYNRSQGLTYEALGKRIKRSRSQVQRWLSSSYNMNLKSLGLLAEGMDADLMIEVKPRGSSTYETNYCHPREAARAHRATISIEPKTLFFQSDEGWDVSSNSKPSRHGRVHAQSKKTFVKGPVGVIIHG